jgi:hypothetical protein
MSTYLLAWVVGKLHGKTVTNQHGVEITTYTALNQDVDSVDFANEVAARSLEFYDDATGIADVRSKMSDAVTEDWYSLDGRKLQGRPTKKGLYLLNGKKVVVR